MAVNDLTLVSTGSFGVAGLEEEQIQFMDQPIVGIPVATGTGNLTHPDHGSYDYEVKPDEWVNVDADAIIAPVWSSDRTLTGAASVLWSGNLRDVVVEERWKSLGGLAMTIEQLRAFVAVWTTPVDPAVGYVTWSPSYHSGVAFKVIPIGLTVGGRGVTLNDLVNYQDENGDAGWVTEPVVWAMRLVERL